MPEFIPILVVAVVILVGLMLVFGTVISFPSEKKPGGTTVSGTSKTLALGKNFTITSTVGEDTKIRTSAIVSRGIISSKKSVTSFELADPLTVTDSAVKFRVNDTNFYGKMQVKVNDKTVYSDYPLKGMHSFNLDHVLLGKKNTVVVDAESSGWRIWAPTTYILDSFNVSVGYKGIRSKTLKFVLSDDERDTLTGASLLIDLTGSGGRLIGRLNSIEQFRTKEDVDKDIDISFVKSGDNYLELGTEANSMYNINSVDLLLSFE